MRNRRYVVATDLSPPSRDAIAHAAVLARAAGAALELFCAVPASIADDEKKLVGRVREGLDRLRDLAGGIPTDCLAVVAKDVPKAIAARAEAVGADILVVGPSGVTGWKKFVLGSVTERLLRLAPVSLLVARGRPQGPPSKILAALDMTTGAARAFRTALELARACGAKLVALHAVTPPGAALMAAGDVYLPETWTLEAERIAAAQREFGDWLRTFPREGVEIEARVVEGNAAEVIVAEAQACEASLVVVGSRGRTAVHEFFVGSVARSVATHATVPVLVVRARPSRRRAAPPESAGGPSDPPEVPAPETRSQESPPR